MKSQNARLAATFKKVVAELHQIKSASLSTQSTEEYVKRVAIIQSWDQRKDLIHWIGQFENFDEDDLPLEFDHGTTVELCDEIIQAIHDFIFDRYTHQAAGVAVHW